jgi:hypothetical protein
MIGKGLGDCVVLTATDTATINTFIDSNNLYIPDKMAKGRIIYFTSGDNIGLKRIVTDSNQGNFSVTYEPSVTDVPVAADVAELWRKRGMGFDPVEDVNAQINNAIRRACQTAWIDDIATIATPATFDTTSPRFALPANTRGVHMVEFADSQNANLWHPIDKSRDPSGPGWSMERDAGGAYIVIGGDAAYEASGATIRVRRYVDDAPLVLDSDTTTISLDWILAEVKALLLEVAVDTNPKDGLTYSRWQVAREDSKVMRGSLGGRPMPDTVIV